MENKIITCKKGWEKLYTPIINKIYEFDDKQNRVFNKIGVASIFSSDGRLNITVKHTFNSTEEINNMIKKASYDSANVCEYCGNEDDVGITMNGKITTCCRDCWEKHVLTQNEDSIWKNYKSNKCYRKNQKI